MMEFSREARQRIARVQLRGFSARRRVAGASRRRAPVRHPPGACMTVPQTLQVRCALLE
jgi:hypothetical protein